MVKGQLPALAGDNGPKSSDDSLQPGLKGRFGGRVSGRTQGMG